MKLKGEAVYAGAKAMPVTAEFPEPSFMVTLMDEEGGSIVAWARAGVMDPATTERLKEYRIELDVFKSEGFGDRPSGWKVHLVSMDPKGSR